MKRSTPALDAQESCTASGAFTFEAARETALTMSGGTSNRIVGCTIRNAGGSALRVAGGSYHSVVGCDIYQTGQGGIHLEGGDRQNLTPAGHYADLAPLWARGEYFPLAFRAATRPLPISWPTVTLLNET